MQYGHGRQATAGHGAGETVDQPRHLIIENTLHGVHQRTSIGFGELTYSTIVEYKSSLK
jgi:hypothetical protein